MDTWEKQMASLFESASYLNSLNVLELQFQDGRVLDVYVAANREERARGLSNLEALDTCGMLFYFDKPSYVPFTMADMKIDLSIGWYDERGQLLRKGDYKAGQHGPLFSSQPFTYVVETPLGWLPESNLKVKDGNG